MMLRNYVIVVLFLGTGFCQANDIQPGIDLFFTESGSGSNYDFVVEADLFGPGSDPSIYPDFVVQINPPISNPYDNPSGGMGLILNRLAPAVLPSPPPSSQASVPIEIVALNLFSVDPVVVTYNGGQTNELWDLRINAAVNPQQLGTMTVLHDHPDGGSFFLSQPVKPLLTFTRQLDGQQVFMSGPLENLVTSNAVAWSHTQPGGVFILPDPLGGFSQSNFWVGVTPGNASAPMQPLVLQGTNLNLSLIVAPIPEPTTFLAAFIGFSIVSLSGRRYSRR